MVEKIPEAETQIRIFRIPASETAEKTSGAKIYATMIMLRALMDLTKAVSKESMIKAIRETISVTTIKMNLNAFEKRFNIGCADVELNSIYFELSNLNN